MNSLSDNERKNIKQKHSSNLFKFGDNKIVQSTKIVTFPVVIGNIKASVTADVIDYDIPLLLSKESMKRGNTKIDFSSDKVIIFGQSIDVTFTTCGHYCISIKNQNCDNKTQKISTSLFCKNISDSTKDEKDKIAQKLHRQFSHPSSDKLLQLINDSGINDNELKESIIKLDTSCNICNQYKRAKPRPVVGFPLARTFNETLAMDLKQYSYSPSVWLLHIIDHATRFSVSCVIKSKAKEVIVKKLYEHWISTFGCPQKILVDNGGEFANREFETFCENMNIRIQTTAAESPWSNGLVERHNAVLGLTVNKTVDDTKCDLEMAVAWAVSAKNSLKNVHGYSPNQLVFGRNTNHPCAENDKLPALENKTSSQIVADNLNTLHSARENYIKSESSEKLKRALKHNVRTHSETVFNTGNVVFYKRSRDKKWSGPATVIGSDNQQILLKHGSFTIRVHSSNVTLRDSAYSLDPPLGEQRMNNTIHSSELSVNADEFHPLNVENISPMVQTSTNASVSVDINSANNSGHSVDLPDETISQCSIMDLTNLDHELTSSEESTGVSTSGIDAFQYIPEENIIQQSVLNLDNQETALPSSLPESSDSSDNSSTRHQPDDYFDSKTAPKKGQVIECKCTDNDYRLIEIMSRAGKATGKSKNWYNVKNLENDSLGSLDWNSVVKWKPKDTNDVLITIKCLDEKNIDSNKLGLSKLEELNKWKDNEVYEIIKHKNEKLITTRWVHSEKYVNGEPIIKSRLVARGFQEENSDLPTDSPTCTKEGLRISLTTIATNNWKCQSLDIKSAFLQGKPIERDVFVKPPKESGTSEDHIWKLKKNVYGLSDASRSWYMSVKEKLVALGCTPTKTDPCVFTYQVNGKLEGICCIHVDDFIHGGTGKFINDVVNQIRAIFVVGTESFEAFKYLGLDIVQGHNYVTIDQTDYIDTIESIIIAKDRKQFKNEILNEKELGQFRSLVGQLGWVARESRPDISFDICYLSSRFKHATIQDIFDVNKVLNRIKNNPILIKLGLESLENLEIVAYNDASFGNLNDGGSQGAVMIFLKDQKGNLSPISWESKKLRRTVKSAMAAETLEQVESFESSFWIGNIVKEILGLKESPPISCYTDSHQVYDSVYTIRPIKDKRLRIDRAILKEMLERGDIQKLQWIPKDKQIADPLTKHGAQTKLMLQMISGQLNHFDFLQQYA